MKNKHIMVLIVLMNLIFCGSIYADGEDVQTNILRSFLVYSEIDVDPLCPKNLVTKALDVRCKGVEEEKLRQWLTAWKSDYFFEIVEDDDVLAFRVSTIRDDGLKVALVVMFTVVDEVVFSVDIMFSSER